MYSTSVLNDKKRKADGSDTDYSASDSTSASASDADANSIASEASATRSSRNSIAAAAPKRIYIRKEDIAKYGHTPACPVSAKHFFHHCAIL